MKKAVPFFRWIVLVCSITMLGQSRSKLEISKNGIKVYTIQSDTSHYKSYQVIMTVQTPIDSVCKVILDANNLKKWCYKTINSRLIKKISTNSFLFYIENELPWPVQNRDHVSKVMVQKKGNDYTISILPDVGTVPEKQRTVRLKNFRGYWNLKKINATTTQVEQFLYGDPGGAIPPFLANWLVTKAPFETFTNLRDYLEK